MRVILWESICDIGMLCGFWGDVAKFLGKHKILIFVAVSGAFVILGN
jgi:hypothetical protein